MHGQIDQYLQVISRRFSKGRAKAAGGVHPSARPVRVPLGCRRFPRSLIKRSLFLPPISTESSSALYSATLHEVFSREKQLQHRHNGQGRYVEKPICPSSSHIPPPLVFCLPAWRARSPRSSPRLSAFEHLGEAPTSPPFVASLSSRLACCSSWSLFLSSGSGNSMQKLHAEASSRQEDHWCWVKHGP